MNSRANDISLCLWKLQVCIVMVLSTLPVRGQALSLEDITDKECPVSGVVQPNTLDNGNLLIVLTWPSNTFSFGKLELTPLSQKNLVCRFMRSADMPKKLSRRVLIMMGVDGGIVLPLLSGGIKVISVHWIKVKIGLDGV